MAELETGSPHREDQLRSICLSLLRAGRRSPSRCIPASRAVSTPPGAGVHRHHFRRCGIFLALRREAHSRFEANPGAADWLRRRTNDRSNMTAMTMNRLGVAVAAQLRLLRW